jgi:hypothetical protein
MTSLLIEVVVWRDVKFVHNGEHLVNAMGDLGERFTGDASRARDVSGSCP